jgi:hypothetical protein
MNGQGKPSNPSNKILFDNTSHEGWKKSFLNTFTKTWIDSDILINGGQNIQQSNMIVYTSAARHVLRAEVETSKCIHKTNFLIANGL